MLHHLEISTPEASDEAIFVLHGIIGQAANWRTFIQQLVAKGGRAARYRWILVDLRGHGESGPGDAPHTVSACADDLTALATSLGVAPVAVFGHSFGGKVALAFARIQSSIRVATFLDTPLGPVGDTPGMRQIQQVLEGVAEIGDEVPGRAGVSKVFQERGLPLPVARWMGTNVKGNRTEGYRWSFSPDVIMALVADYADLDLWPLLESPREGLRVFGVRGGASDSYTPEDIARFGPHDVPAIDGAGHWLHVDDPAALSVHFERILTHL